nr:Ycf53 [Sahlingia subintegra]
MGDNITVTKKIQLLEDLDIENVEVLNVFYLFLEQKALKKLKEFDCIDGTIYRLLLKSENPDIAKKLNVNFSDGLVDSHSQFYDSYLELQDLLLNNNFQEADKLTSQLLCLFVDIKNRSWLYFSDVKKIPESELKILDNLWKTYSKGKFGFSVQRQIWLGNNQDWNLLWDKIGWRQKEVLCRYPEEFIWDLTAPIGHLPLSNQLRGIQTLKALFNLTIWN